MHVYKIFPYFINIPGNSAVKDLFLFLIAVFLKPLKALKIKGQIIPVLFFKGQVPLIFVLSFPKGYIKSFKVLPGELILLLTHIQGRKYLLIFLLAYVVPALMGETHCPLQGFLILFFYHYSSFPDVSGFFILTLNAALNFLSQIVTVIFVEPLPFILMVPVSDISATAGFLDSYFSGSK